jgi:hypothetical protein
MTEPMRLCTWACVTWWATKGIKGLHYDPIRVRHSLKVITIWKRQTKQVIVIRSRMIHLRWYWIPTFLLQVKMHLWVDVYVMMHLHDAVMHMLWCNATCSNAIHFFLELFQLTHDSCRQFLVAWARMHEYRKTPYEGFTWRNKSDFFHTIEIRVELRDDHTTIL